MPDLQIDFCGVKAPNPFWLASAPPTNSEYQVRRAFDAGWGGAVWKTLGFEPIVNVSLALRRRRLRRHESSLGLNNIELITDRTLDDNFARSRRVKKAYPKHALWASLMVESKREAWHEITKRTQDTGADGIELNFGCPHGMSERGMGVGRRPGARLRLHDHRMGEGSRHDSGDGEADAQRRRRHGRRPGGRARRGRRAVAHQHDQLDHGRRPRHARAEAGRARPGQPRRLLRPGREADRAQHGRRDRRTTRRFRCRSAASAASRPGRTPSSSCCSVPARVQVCTAVMHYGFRIVEHLTSGLENWMREKKFEKISDFVGKSAPTHQALGRPRPQLQSRRRDRSAEVHPLRAVLHRLRGRRPPVDPLGASAEARIHAKRLCRRKSSAPAASKCCRAQAAAQ